MIKYLGTHNSGTSSKLVWWQRPLGFILHATSRCQTLSIEEQLKRNVRLFNLQITYHKKQWVFSHGLCIYTDKFYDAINMMVKYATKESPVHFQLFLDKNFLLGQNRTEFIKLVDDLVDELKGTNVYMRYAYIEGTKEYIYQNLNNSISTSEHYWTMGWANNNARNWIDKLPLPKRHAKEFNQKYIDENKADYLMLDFIEIGNYPEPVKPVVTTTFRPTTTTSKKPVTTTTFTPTTTVLNETIFKNGNKKYVFKSGYNFSMKLYNSKSKCLEFDFNGETPKNIKVSSKNSKVVSVSLDKSYRLININTKNSGSTRIAISIEYDNVKIDGYIIVNVYNNTSTTTSVLPTTTTTYIA